MKRQYAGSLTRIRSTVRGIESTSVVPKSASSALSEASCVPFIVVFLLVYRSNMIVPRLAALYNRPVPQDRGFPTSTPGTPTMDGFFFVMRLVLGLISLGCFAFVIMKMFQDGESTIAIVCLVGLLCGIGGLVAFG